MFIVKNKSNSMNVLFETLEEKKKTIILISK